MNKKYAIFDMDGTLIDSMKYWQSLAGEYLKTKGIPKISQELFEKIKPMTMSESAALFVQEFHLSGTPKAVEEEMNQMMDLHYKSDIPLKPGVKAYLHKLKEEGISMCVASATAEPLMEACLRRLGVLDYFEFLISCESVGAGKDRPDVYYEAAKKLGASVQDTAIYEDALYAARTAKSEGFYVVGIYEESIASRWEEMKEIADEVILDWRTA